MKKEEFFASLCFLAVLIFAIIMISTFYICDNGNCRAFERAAEAGPTGSTEYDIALLSGFYQDGMWPLPFIGASILSAISIWFLQVPVTLRNFGILFFVSFAVIYFTFLFFGHHFVVLIAKEVIKQLRNGP